MKKTQWMIYTKRADFKLLAARFSVSPVLARIMTNRGVGEDEMDSYLHGTLSELPDPLLLKDLEKAVRILLEKCREGKRIRIIGDYDIDGICSTYILLTGLKRAGARADYDIPDRVKDGYGLNMNLIEKAHADGTDTILTCDNGIAAIDEIRAAKEYGMTVVVTDHHEVGHDASGVEKLPSADAVVDPKQEGCRYPFDGICGAVVAFYLIRVLYRAAGIPEAEWEELLPFATIATVGDVMSLKHENRIIVKEGLKSIAHTRNEGLKKLIALCGLDPGHMTAYSIGFVIGPCLNAGGRLESAKVGLGMLLETDPDRAERAALHLKELNDERKEMTNRGVRAAVAEVDRAMPDRNVLVVYLPDCHESVAGIIAGKLREAYHKPSIVLTDSAAEEWLKGSGRSIEGYHMFRALEEAEDLLVKFGGHPMAAGLTLKRENAEALAERLNANARLTEDQLTEKIWIDTELPFSHATKRLINELELLEPFGQGNEKPLFGLRGVHVRSVRVLGRNRNVVKLMLADREGTFMEAVAFTDGDAFLQEMGDRRVMSILYYPKIDDYMGRSSVQAVLKGWKF